MSSWVVVQFKCGPGRDRTAPHNAGGAGTARGRHPAPPAFRGMPAGEREGTAPHAPADAAAPIARQIRDRSASFVTYGGIV
ncbi:hypothetical protein GCM10009730_42380 [Streptomyces albidochromogenes]